ncbi:MAG TPA: hypothetical protein VL096_03225, partial [Pirellulaceae bacterium]|nr:hypothetical protein [Pirellulaceae bacterium]
MIGHGENLVASHRSRRRATHAPGMTVVVVLGVISITLALSYAMLRSQVTSVEIQSNLDRRASARQAAYAGISAALRKMHDDSWQGIDVPLQQELSTNQWFEVSFATGDAADTDNLEYPFRVTIHSVGYAENPSQPDVRSTYRVQAVLQLVRKRLNSAPASWANVLNYTTYHWSTNASMIEFPTHVTGPSYFQGQIFISADYPIDPNSRTRYHADLNAMRTAGMGDYRVMTGPIGTPLTKQTAATLTFLQSTMGLTVNSVTSSSSAPATFPSSSSYRLFPGGKLYDAPIIQNQYGSTLAGVTITPDIKTNPLGVFVSNGTLTIGDNVTINGTIIVDGGSEPDIRITGKNVNLLAPTLPKLDGSTTPYQLPVAIVKDDFQIYGTAAASVRGVVAAWDEFAYLRADNTATLDL